MNTTYRDGLVEIDEQTIVFNQYYFPMGSQKRLPLAEIESIEAKTPSALNGKWRIWGGDFRTWFPCDGARPSRSRIFLIRLRNRWRQIGFTVENPAEAESALKASGVRFI